MKAGVFEQGYLIHNVILVCFFFHFVPFTFWSLASGDSLGKIKAFLVSMKMKSRRVKIQPNFKLIHPLPKSESGPHLKVVLPTVMISGQGSTAGFRKGSCYGALTSAEQIGNCTSCIIVYFNLLNRGWTSSYIQESLTLDNERHNPLKTPAIAGLQISTQDGSTAVHDGLFVGSQNFQVGARDVGTFDFMSAFQPSG